MSEDILERLSRRLNDSALVTEYLLDEAAAEITRLRAELEARDGQVAAWLRGRSFHPVTRVYEELATAIETGSYRKDEA